MSDHAYRLLLMKRALARSDAELFGHRPRYLEVASTLAMTLCEPVSSPGIGAIAVIEL